MLKKRPSKNPRWAWFFGVHVYYTNAVPLGLKAIEKQLLSCKSLKIEEP